MKLQTLFAAALLSVSSLSMAATHTVKMLNNGADGIMVFEPGFLKIAKGDTVKFEATDSGHNAVNEFGPAGTAELAGYSGGEYTFNDEGVNIYYCVPHKSMAMYGVIQVGNAVNKDDAMAAAKATDAGMAMNGGRLMKYMDQVK
jgi:pseudoazurin